MRSTFKVLFYVKKGSEKPNGNLPLMCRLTVDGEIKQFSCKMDVPLRLWDVKNNRASGKSVEAQRINLAVDKIRVELAENLPRRIHLLLSCSFLRFTYCSYLYVLCESREIQARKL